MISGEVWSFADDGRSPVWSVQLRDPERAVSIAWDENDKGLYLSVVAPPPVNRPGSERRYSAPLSMLAAMLLLPLEHHDHLHALVRAALNAERDRAMERVRLVVEGVTRPWPIPQTAMSAPDLLAGGLADIERLSLDAATADAWTQKAAV